MKNPRQAISDTKKGRPKERAEAVRIAPEVDAELLAEFDAAYPKLGLKSRAQAIEEGMRRIIRAALRR